MDCGSERCPQCGFLDNVVVDSRPSPMGRRRRRRCPHCDVSWSTVEILASDALDAAILRRVVRDAVATLQAIEATIP